MFDRQHSRCVTFEKSSPVTEKADLGTSSSTLNRKREKKASLF